MLFQSHHSIIIIICTAIALVACSSPAQRKANHEAEAEARQAAEVVLAIDSIEPVDSFALERAILDAKAVQSRWQIDGNQEAYDNFDRTFRDMISTRRPQLAEQIFIHTAEAE